MLETAESTVNAQKPTAAVPPHANAFVPAMEQATLGATVVVKGELTGAQSLYIDGRVEGKIYFSNHRVTVGRGAVVVADIEAKEAVIMGTVTGNIACGDRVDVRGEAVLTGDVITQRISIDSGAMVKGNVEVRRLEKPEEKIQGKTEGPAKAEFQTKEESAAKKPGTVINTSPEAAKIADAASDLARSTSRIAGSKVLYQEHKAGSR